MEYGDLSHTKVSMSHEVKLSWLLDKYFILSKGNLNQNIKEVKESSHGICQWLSANQNTANFLEVE